ncbi:MAG: hydrolase [Rhodospirillaceae bacterium]|nr:hydrolase [Rhodospirillaceae bacterium]
MLIDKEQSVLMVIDIQERLLPVMNEPDMVVENTKRLIKGASILAVDMVASEQYPKGIGHLVDAVSSLLSDGVVREKDTFSCMADDSFAGHFNALNKTQAIICGIEAHVCVLQTTIELINRGVKVFVVSDATSSRTAPNHKAGLDRAKSAGAEIVTTEMVLFEWLRRAGTPEFKEISKLVK